MDEEEEKKENDPNNILQIWNENNQIPQNKNINLNYENNANEIKFESFETKYGCP
jgi:hypothetical protein